MIIALSVMTGLTILCWVLGIVAFIAGKCELDWADYDTWKDERWEKIYSKFIAPAGAICMAADILLCFITCLTT